MNVPYGIKFPFFASPGIKGDYLFINNNIMFSAEDIHFDRMEFYKQEFLKPENNGMHFVFCKSGIAYAFDLDGFDGFAVRFGELKKELNSRHNKIQRFFFDKNKKRFGPSEISGWFPLEGNIKILEHRVMHDQLQFLKYIEIAKNQGYEKVYIRNHDSSVLDILMIVNL